MIHATTKPQWCVQNGRDGSACILPIEVRDAALQARPTADEIMRAVTETTGVPLDEILSTRRHPHIVTAREMATVVLRELTMMSYIEVALVVRGSARHTTVVTAYQRALRWTDDQRQQAQHAAERAVEMAKERKEQ